MQKLVKFIYTETIEVGQYGIDLFVMADKFGLDDMKESCATQVEKLINPSNLLVTMIDTHIYAKVLYKYCLFRLPQLQEDQIKRVLNSSSFNETPLKILKAILKRSMKL